MTSIQTITMIVCAVLILVSIVTPFINIFFRKVRLSDETLPIDTEEEESTEKEESETESTATSEEKPFRFPSVSIILFAHDNARDLEQHLPAILTQDYPAGFEVIVVEGKSEDDTDDVLKKLKNDYKNLYTTFVPDSARYMSRPKLAITLGVKAAKNEWMLLTEPTYHPASDQWLQIMARNCQDDKDIVVGYSNFNDEATDYQRFERLLCQRYILREAQRGTPYRSEPGNLMFRKSTFIDGRSFDGNLKFIRGEYDFIVNKFATSDNTATETHPSSWMIEDVPTRKLWTNHHLFYMETRQHLARSFRHRLP
ncbi:MAG: glycosyltransferase, partial [Prevotella sp.]|nr:glycosyltransferase [Prevotella sp.]